MKKIILIWILLLLVCFFIFSACDEHDQNNILSESTNQPTSEIISGIDSDKICGTTEITSESQSDIHIHSFGEWECIKEPTCTLQGKKERICPCGEREEEGINAIGHTEIIDAAVNVTCTSHGLTEGRHCSVCNEILIAQSLIEAAGHVEVIDAEIIPTCTSNGVTEGKHCSVCNEVIVSQSVVPMVGHIESDWITDSKSTLEYEGEKHTECIVCGTILNIESIPKLCLSQNEIKSRLKSSVVKVICYDYDGKTEISQGSGFFIDSWGTFITNAHVVEDCYYIKIETYIGLTYDVDVMYVYNDTSSDYAICKASGCYSSNPVEFAESANVGDVVYALGYPNDSILMSTTSGIITSANVNEGLKSFYANTAWIDHGSSGGILVNGQGKVIGITTGVFSDGEYAAIKYQDFKSDAERYHFGSKSPMEYFHTVDKINLLSYNLDDYLDVFVEGTVTSNTSVSYWVTVRLKDEYRNAKIVLDSSMRITLKLDTVYQYKEIVSYGVASRTNVDAEYIYFSFYDEDDLITGEKEYSTSSIFISSFKDYYGMEISYEVEFFSGNGTLIVYDK